MKSESKDILYLEISINPKKEGLSMKNKERRKLLFILVGYSLFNKREFCFLNKNRE